MRVTDASTSHVDGFRAPPPDDPDALLLIGHSHVNCVAQATLARGIRTLHAFNFWALPGALEHADGKARLAAEIVRRLDHHHGKVFSMIGGSVHTVVGMLVHPRRFDFVLPAQPDLPRDPDAELVPALAVRRILEARMAEYLSLMEQVLAHSPAGMVHLQPPPPSANGDRVFADVPWSMYPPEMKHEVSPVALRYKLWRLESQVLREWCASHGVVLVPCPPACLDAGGCLGEDCYADGAHANGVYGWHVYQQMEQLA